MSQGMLPIPVGSGKHPVVMVVISAQQLPVSATFYTRVFGWQMHALSAELSTALAPGRPAITLRANTPEGFPGVVPFIGVADVEGTLAKVTEAGASVERAPWTIPMVGRLARFRDSSGTIYGLTNAAGGARLRVPMPFGDNPKPPTGSVCSLEMYAAKGADAAAFFGTQFGWGCAETMPQFMGFDPGTGIPGVFQSHTPSLPAVAYVYVTDVHAALAAVEAAGGQHIGDPMAMPGMATFGYFKDPSGTTMGLIGP